MGKRKKRIEAPAPVNNQVIAARLLLVFATAIAGYLAWGSLSGGGIAGCGPASGCDKVLSSRWAYWLGMPVSIPAIATYLAMLIASFKIESSSVSGRRSAWLVIIGLSVMVIGAVLWFGGLQAIVLKSFCKFCCTAHAGALVASALLLRSSPVFQDGQGTGKPAPGIPFGSAVSATLLGLSGLVVLGFGQLLVQKAGFEVTKVAPASETPVVEGSAEAEATPETPKVAETAGGARELSLHNGKIRLNLDEVPIIGSPAAPHVMVSLFDYTCHHCRDMHGLLLQAKAKFGDQLAIVTLPMPMDSNCNRLIKQTPVPHMNACEYAKYGLAVWRAKPEAFEEFDSWVFSPASPPDLATVQAHAAELVGVENLQRAFSEDWVGRQIAADVALFEANYREVGRGSMPQLIIGGSISVGALRGVDDLYQMLGESFGLR